ncbi:MAG: oxidoreductase domain protein [Bryobacterales bacterium]|nr:oxidoreductase domain protein [Bryobacterales bacterium]
MNVALLGLGYMGATHAKAWTSVSGARLAAVMSSDERKLSGDLTGIEGNLGNSGEKLDFSGAKKYRRLEDVVADPDIDAVDICLPTDLHASAAAAALRAGKHVLVEKPIALQADVADALVIQAGHSGKILMAGQVLRFVPSYLRLREELSTSGAVRSAFFRRRCAAPAWSRWLADPAKSGGGVFDLLIHDVDFCISLWGVPQAVRASGYEELAAGIDWIHAELKYPGLGPVVVTGGWHHPKSYPFSMEFTVVTAAATFDWPFGGALLNKYGADGEVSHLTLSTADPFAAELTYFTECVSAGHQPDFCPPAQSAAAVRVMRDMLDSRSRNGEEITCR